VGAKHVSALRVRDVADEARSELTASGATVCRGLVNPSWLSEALVDAISLFRIANTTSGGVSFVSLDLFPAESPIRQLYESDELLAFASAACDRPMYRYADPQGGLNLSIMGPGAKTPWHLDHSDFVISLCLQPAVTGGALCVRSKTIEGVKAGDAVLLAGRRTLHGVTDVGGINLRVAALFAFHRRPHVRSPLLVRLVRYGLSSVTRYQQGSPP
jgi:hypothetical protein